MSLLAHTRHLERQTMIYFSLNHDQYIGIGTQLKVKSTSNLEL